MSRAFPICLALAAVFAANRVALAIDHVTYRVDGQLEQRDGQVVADKAGALLFMTPDLRLTLVQADEVVEHTVDDEDFEPLDRKALEAERVATVLVHLTPADPVPLVIRAERRMRRKELALAKEDLLTALALDSEGPVGQAAAEHLKRIQFERPF